MTFCSFLISSPDGFGEERKSWLAELSLTLVLAFASFSADCWLGIALEVMVVDMPALVGVGLLLIKLSTKADVTLGSIVDENVLASGGTIGMKGIGCGGLMG